MVLCEDNSPSNYAPVHHAVWMAGIGLGLGTLASIMKLRLVPSFSHLLNGVSNSRSYMIWLAYLRHAVRSLQRAVQRPRAPAVGLTGRAAFEALFNDGSDASKPRRTSARAARRCHTLPNRLVR